MRDYSILLPKIPFYFLEPGDTFLLNPSTIVMRIPLMCFREIGGEFFLSPAALDGEKEKPSCSADEDNPQDKK